MTVAVVFAYHDVGARCLQVLLDRGIRVPLVVTHKDDPRENIWFDSVSQLAGTHGIRVATPEDPNTDELLQIITALRPDFIFSFYYRHMLGRPLLDAARLGALNMHGSLLPKYRGRAPVNWAVINGERETGATLHYMVEKADAGDIVDRQAVPIHSNDTALDVFRRVTIAAADVLSRNLSCLVNGTAPRIAQNQKEASYFGARRAEDGRSSLLHQGRRRRDGDRLPAEGTAGLGGGRRERVREHARHDEARQSADPPRRARTSCPHQHSRRVIPQRPAR